VFLHAGLKVNMKTRKGTNALHFAAKKGHMDVVNLLIKRKANVSAEDRKGNTAMDLASDAAVKEALQAAIDDAAQPQVRWVFYSHHAAGA
jgi:ankyrin repeat protein